MLADDNIIDNHLSSWPEYISSFSSCHGDLQSRHTAHLKRLIFKRPPFMPASISGLINGEAVAAAMLQKPAWISRVSDELVARQDECSRTAAVLAVDEC